VRTHGRQMNMHEPERIAGLLDEASFAPVADGVQPGVVFSTRAVRKNADNKLAGNLDHLKRVKHRSPGMQIAVGLRRMFSLAGRDAVEILVFEVALGPLENALNSLGRFQMSTTRQGRTAVRRVGYRARLPTVPGWSMLKSEELSELFDVLGPWRRAACWLLRDRPLTMSTTGSSRCAAPSMDLASVCA